MPRRLARAPHVRVWNWRNSGHAGYMVGTAAIDPSETCGMINAHLSGSYSITSSARSKMDGGTSRPRVFAVLRLSTNSNLVGC